MYSHAPILTLAFVSFPATVVFHTTPRYPADGDGGELSDNTFNKSLHDRPSLVDIISIWYVSVDEHSTDLKTSSPTSHTSDMMAF